MSFTVKKASKEPSVLDNIGNRLSTTNSSSTNVYTANNLNQYSDIDGTNLTYDLDGNMTSNGEWTYTWNGENRLISASNGTTVVAMGYDYMGRRFTKTTNSVTTTFVYDGWNMIRESSPTETNHYVWGLDLSGTVRGAGGVGGLLSMTKGSGETYLYSYDANGNVMQLVDASDGSVDAKYEYDAFGNITSQSELMANQNPFRFSSKYQDETGLNYYAYRYYDAKMGRWLSRDPIEEEWFLEIYQPMIRNMLAIDSLFRLDQPPFGYMGGLNLFGFVRNDSLSQIDFLGLGLFGRPDCDEDHYKDTYSPLFWTWGKWAAYGQNGQIIRKHGKQSCWCEAKKIGTKTVDYCGRTRIWEDCTGGTMTTTDDMEPQGDDWVESGDPVYAWVSKSPKKKSKIKNRPYGGSAASAPNKCKAQCKTWIDGLW